MQCFYHSEQLLYSKSVLPKTQVIRKIVTLCSMRLVSILVFNFLGVILSMHFVCDSRKTFKFLIIWESLVVMVVRSINGYCLYLCFAGALVVQTEALILTEHLHH